MMPKTKVTKLCLSLANTLGYLGHLTHFAGALQPSAGTHHQTSIESGTPR